MGETAIAFMNADEFFAWQEKQEELYELVDGLPLQMMTGASNRHDQITVNVIAELATRLRGKPCRPRTQDTSIKISDAQTRRPDVAIDCGPNIDKSYIANDPRAVFEVLSPSTRMFDQARKLEEYKSVSSIRHIVLIDPDNPEVIVFTRRDDASWASNVVSGLDKEIEFESLGFNLPLAEVYRDLTFSKKPSLIEPE